MDLSEQVGLRYLMSSVIASSIPVFTANTVNIKAIWAKFQPPSESIRQDYVAVNEEKAYQVHNITRATELIHAQYL